MKSNSHLVPLDTTTRSKRSMEEANKFGVRVVGQKEAQNVALSAIARSRNALRDPDAPIGVYLLVGESRSGKTKVVETVAEIAHGDKRCMVKINCGTMKQRHEVARVVGAPPGYLGHKPAKDEEELKPGEKPKVDRSAKLSRANLIASRGESKNPITIVLLDEVDLAHEDFDDILMSIFDKGELDMGNNHVTDFRDCIIFMTANRGTKEAHRRAKTRKIGFGIGASNEAPGLTPEVLHDAVWEALRERYRPEWLNRLTEVVIFPPLKEDELRKVVDFEVDAVVDRMQRTLDRGKLFELDVFTCARDWMLEMALYGMPKKDAIEKAKAESRGGFKEGEEPQKTGNVADLKRIIQKHLIDPLGNPLEDERIRGGDVVVVTYEPGSSGLTFYIDTSRRIPAGVDGPEVREETPETRDLMYVQRKIAREKASDKPRFVFDVTLQANSEGAMVRKAGQVMREIKEIYGVTLVAHRYTSVKPFTATFEVIATQEQADILRTREPKLKIVVRSESAGA